MSTGPVAVIDLGSNSIKVLVAARGDDGSLGAVGMKTLDVRISAGISSADPRLSEDGMRHGLEAVRELLGFARDHQAARVVIAATSAVRDARNGDAFRARLESETGHPVRTLSGEEEAALVGRGLSCDPVLRDLQEFQVFDLGGGSLECLLFRQRRLHDVRSLPLGCVRLTERFVSDVIAPFPATAAMAISDHVRHELAESGFAFDRAGGAAVFAGGTMTTTRAILGAAAGQALEATSSQITRDALSDLLQWLGAMPLAQRRQVPGLPSARADIFPTALATVIAVADVARVDVFQHSFYNLRWGLAAEAFDAA